MDAFNYRIKRYQEVLQISENQIKDLVQRRKIVFFFNLVIDFTDFRHPGYDRTIEEFQNRQISTVFQSSSHSFNAQMLVCRLTVGKLKNSQYEKSGKVFYERVRQQTKNVKYQAALDKIDFSKGLLKQLQKLSVDQLNLLTQIPTIFKNPDKIHFLEGGKYQNFKYQEHFWITFSLFILYFILIISWLFNTFDKKEIMQNIGFFAFGVVKWTILQYYFHRFIYHYEFKSFKDIRGHLLHHMFPNINRKVAISIIGMTIKIALVGIAYTLFLKPLYIGLIFAGFIGTIIAYDSLHYYCHFGSQIDIKWLKYLRISHLKHHYRDSSRFFGVTNTFWDAIFGTGSSKNEQIKTKD